MIKAILLLFLFAPWQGVPTEWRQIPIKVKRVIDGDTFVVDLDLGFGHILRNRRVQLAGRNWHQVKSKKEAKEVSTHWIDDFQPLRIYTRTIKNNKGAILADLCPLYYTGRCLSFHLAAKGMIEEE